MRIAIGARACRGLHCPDLRPDSRAGKGGCCPAAAAADPDIDWWGKPYSAAYKAARAYYDANPLPISQEIADLAASQEGAVLELLELLIDPSDARR